MMIENIRNQLKGYLFQRHHFRFNGSRNQIEEFNGVIKQLFPRVFTIELDNGMTRSFSYSDVATNLLEIIGI